MKLIFTHIALFISLISCESPLVEPYETFIIKKGTHGPMDKVELLQSTSLTFSAIFDESAIYTSRIEVNQHDVNKLMGFSDCNDLHQRNSARFGWRWLNDQLEILAYAYVNGQRIVEPIGTVALHEPAQYQLIISDHTYTFLLNELPPVVVDRVAKCNKGGYYLLFPYFGGDEVAPHDITINIKRKY